MLYKVFSITIVDKNRWSGCTGCWLIVTRTNVRYIVVSRSLPDASYDPKKFVVSSLMVVSKTLYLINSYGLIVCCKLCLILWNRIDKCSLTKRQLHETLLENF